MADAGAPRRWQTASGFTLLEVLIALVVFSLSAFAVIRQTSLSAQQTGYLEQKTFALWIAENKLAQYRTEETWPALGSHREDLSQFNQNWWLDVEVYNTSEPLLRRVEVKIGQPEDESVILTLQGFLGKH